MHFETCFIYLHVLHLHNNISQNKEYSLFAILQALRISIYGFSWIGRVGYRRPLPL